MAELLADPTNALTCLSSQTFEGLPDIEYWHKIPFESQKLTPEQLDVCLTPEAPANGLALDLPPVNPFLPEKFAIEKNIPMLL